MEKLLCPSMMCADYGRLAEEIKALDEAGVDIFHCDIMDSTFVPNITMGLMDLKTIRKYTKKPVRPLMACALWGFTTSEMSR